MARGDIIGMNPDGSAIVDDGAGGTLDVAADFAGDAVNRPAPAPRIAPPGDLYARPTADESAMLSGGAGGILAPAAPPPAPGPTYVMSPEEAAFLEENPEPAPRPDTRALLEEGVRRAAEDRAAAAARASHRRAAEADAAARATGRTEDLVRRVASTGSALDATREALPGLEADARGSATPLEEYRANRYAELLRAAGDDPTRLAAAWTAINGETPEERSSAYALAMYGSDDPRAVTAAGPTGSVMELPGRSITAPSSGAAPAVGAPPSTGGRGRGGTGGARPAGAPAAPPTPPGETFVDLLTNRPAGDAPLFAERSESPLDRALGRNADSMALEQRRAEIEAAGYADTRDALAGAEAARAENETNRRAAMADARNRYRSALDRASAMRVDPEGWFHDRGVGGTIGAAIAVGLGAIGSGITGGDNTALSIINDSIERDLQAQSANIESAFRSADGEATILDQMSREFSSRDAAIEASRAALLDQAAARVSELMASTNAEEVRINGAAMRDQLTADARAAEAAAMQAEIDQAIATRTAMAEMRSAEAEATRDERRAMGGGGPSYSTPTDAMLSTANRLIDSGVSPEDAAAAVGIDPRFISGAGRFAESSTPESAGNLAALSASMDRIEELMGPEDADVPGVGMTGMLDDRLLSSEGADLRSEIENTIDLLGRIRSGGAIGPEERETFRRILRGGTGTDRALREGVRRLRAEIDARTNRHREGDTLDADIASWMSAAGLTEVPDAAP